MTAKSDKDFIALSGKVLNISPSFLVLKIGSFELEIPSSLAPKNIKENDDLMITFSTLAAYEQKIEINAKKILNEILGN